MLGGRIAGCRRSRRGSVASEVDPQEQTVEADAAAASSARPFSWRDIRSTVRRHADELISTEAEAASLEALRVATGETDGGMERHTVRQYLIAERIADTRHISYDRELLLCASFLHDAGLYGPASTSDVYIKDSARYARRTLEPFGCKASPQAQHPTLRASRSATRALRQARTPLSPLTAPRPTAASRDFRWEAALARLALGDGP